MPNDLSQKSDSSYFNNPVDEKTKLSLLKTLATTKTNVQIYKDEEKLESMTYPTTDFSKITVIYSNSEAHQSFKKSKELTCHFSLHNEIYFFKSQVLFTEVAVIFSTPTIIYKIQRRDNFRVMIPKNLTQNIEVVGHKELKASLADLSLGGCKITLVYPDASYISHLKRDSEIQLKMKFLSFENLTVYGKVKFIHDNPSTKSASIGLQFEKLKAEDAQEMQANIFKIDRLNRQ